MTKQEQIEAAYAELKIREACEAGFECRCPEGPRTYDSAQR